MPTDPVFSFANAVTDHLANRQQRLYALAYLRALQLHPGVPLRRALPPALYRPVRRFVADAEWDGREVIRRAVAEVAPYLEEVEWLACRVSGVRRGYAWAWLAASTAESTVPLDVALVGPAGLTRSAADYVPAQVEILKAAPTEVLERAPLALAGVLAERSDVRGWLDKRGVIYSARVRPSSPLLGRIGTARGTTSLPRLLEQMSHERKHPGSGKASRSRIQRTQVWVLPSRVSIVRWRGQPWERRDLVQRCAPLRSNRRAVTGVGLVVIGVADSIRFELDRLVS